jgi:hypothetical protein
MLLRAGSIFLKLKFEVAHNHMTIKRQTDQTITENSPNLLAEITIAMNILKASTFRCDEVPPKSRGLQNTDEACNNFNNPVKLQL